MNLTLLDAVKVAHENFYPATIRTWIGYVTCNRICQGRKKKEKRKSVMQTLLQVKSDLLATV